MSASCRSSTMAPTARPVKTRASTWSGVSSSAILTAIAGACSKYQPAISGARRRRRGSALCRPPRPRSGTGCSGRAGGRRGPSSSGLRGLGSPLRARPARWNRGSRPPRRCPARSPTACARAHLLRMIGVLFPSLPAFLMLAKLEHDVGQLGDEELFYREPDRVARPWQARHELGAYGSSDRAAHDRCGPDLLVREHPEDLAETVELLLDHAVDDLVGRVAPGDPGPTRRNNSVHFWIRKQVYEARPDAIHLVPDDLAGHYLLPCIA